MQAPVIELRDYLRLFWKEKWLILGIWGATLAIVAGVSVLLPSQYTTRTTLLVAPRISEQLTEEESLSGTLSPEAYKTLAFANDLLQEVIRTLDLRRGFRGPESEPELLSVQGLKRHLRVDVTPSGSPIAPKGFRSPLLILTVQGTEPLLLSRIANTWAKLFIERNTQLLATATAQSYEFIRERFTEIREELADKEEEWKQYQRENPFKFLESELQGLSDRYEELLGEMEGMKLEHAAQLARLARLEKTVAEEPPYVETRHTIPPEALWEFLSRIIGAPDLGALEKLSLVEQEPNPVYLALREEWARTQADAAALEGGIRYLEAALGDLAQGIEQKAARLAEVQLTLDRLDREITALSETYTTLFARLQEARIAKAESASSIRIVESAIVPQEPMQSRTLLYLALAAVLGLLLGVTVTSFKIYMTYTPFPPGEPRGGQQGQDPHGDQTAPREGGQGV
jgi:uncharacterized protein involved in exopolysaccharide biosynthesis